MFYSESCLAIFQMRIDKLFDNSEIASQHLQHSYQINGIFLLVFSLTRPGSREAQSTWWLVDVSLWSVTIGNCWSNLKCMIGRVSSKHLISLYIASSVCIIKPHFQLELKVQSHWCLVYCNCIHEALIQLTARMEVFPRWWEVSKRFVLLYMLIQRIYIQYSVTNWTISIIPVSPASLVRGVAGQRRRGVDVQQDPIFLCHNNNKAIWLFLLEWAAASSASASHQQTTSPPSYQDGTFSIAMPVTSDQTRKGRHWPSTVFWLWTLLR